MKIPRFYQDDNLKKCYTTSKELAFSAKNHRHAIQVLRLKVDEPLIIFNGRESGEYFAKIKAFDKRNSTVALESFDEVNRESPAQITLNLAMIKPDKMDFALQKAVELGVASVQPLYTDRSVIKIKANRLEKKMEHWQGVIIGACEQSGRTALPSLNEPISLSDCLDKRDENSLCIVLLPNANSKFTDLKHQENDQPISLYIGPEGGFSDNEEQQMLDKGVSSVSFGPRILRAETAVISALTTVQQRWGDL